MKFIVTKQELALFVNVFLYEILQVTFSLSLATHASQKQALYKHCYQNISDASAFHCVRNCLNDCSCLSFQTCGSTCQLCSSSKLQNPEDMHENKDCTNYVFPGAQRGSQCGDDGSPPINCCLTSQPCLNGGTCQPVLPPTSHKRFSCACPDGYQGDRCEATCPSGYGGKECQSPIKSCRGYAKRSRIPGNYTIKDDQNKPLKVFCDFNHTTAMTWTLVQSYKLSQNELFRNKPLYEDHPINNRIPSWKKYRLSYDQMTSIQQDSTQWRVTCRYDTDGVNNTDYMSGLKNKLDILNYDGVRCINVEYINIRNESCTNCTVRLWQRGGWILHFYSDYACPSSCNVKPSFHPSPKICDTSADYFGGYGPPDPNHRCSSDPKATTQTWFGGY